MFEGAQLAGPIIALATIVILAAVLHRSLREAEPAPITRRYVRPSPETEDFGLLAVAAVARTQADAMLIKEHLRGAGIRATLAAGPDGQVKVLVFADELRSARRVVG